LPIFQSIDTRENIGIGSFTSCTERRSIFEEGRGDEGVWEGDKARTEDGVIPTYGIKETAAILPRTIFRYEQQL
jgi:hypothetical protein